MNDQADPFLADKRAHDLEAKRQLFIEANSLLEERSVFMLAVRSLRVQWHNEWLASKDWETDQNLKARLQALLALPAEINRFINDYKAALSKQQKPRGM